MLLVWLCGLALAADADAIAPFSGGTPGRELPAGWHSYALGRPQRLTDYSLVDADGRVVLKAVADASASALIHPLRARPKETPWLTWSWRVERVLAKADILTKAGDDYPARVYVLFDYDTAKLPVIERVKLAAARLVYGDAVPAAALCYVWDNRQPVGFATWSAYTKRLRMIVLESGAERIGRWVREQRNVAQDFRNAFADEAPPITAVIVAADTDNTGEKAVSYFGDIALRPTPNEAR
jgi:DUF3047 family protein